MKYNIPVMIVALLILAACTVFEVNYLDYSSPIPFSKINEITFKDFNGYAKPGSTLDGMSEFAYVSVNREIEYPSDSTVEITSYFHPSRSYVYNQQIRSPELLKHELYHFRITEYCSRLLRAEVNSVDGKLSRQQIKLMNKRYTALENELQRRYDHDTYHSYVLSEQKKWEARIDTDLLSLENFSGTVTRFQR